jgi:hypothetical protein
MTRGSVPGSTRASQGQEWLGPNLFGWRSRLSCHKAGFQAASFDAGRAAVFASPRRALPPASCRSPRPHPKGRGGWLNQVRTPALAILTLWPLAATPAAFGQSAPDLARYQSVSGWRGSFQTTFQSSGSTTDEIGRKIDWNMTVSTTGTVTLNKQKGDATLLVWSGTSEGATKFEGSVHRKGLNTSDSMTFQGAQRVPANAVPESAGLAVGGKTGQYCLFLTAQPPSTAGGVRGRADRHGGGSRSRRGTPARCGAA